MPTTNEDFLDVISSMPDDIKRISSTVFDSVDDILDKISSSLKHSLSSSQWLPETLKPRSLPVSHRPVYKPVPPSVYKRILGWLLKHKVLTGVTLVTISGFTYYIISKKTCRKKRKAARAKDGSRLEVVVIAGQPGEPITRSISLDLERRGFIVFIVCSTNEDERHVQNEARPDIKPLAIDIRNPLNAKHSIQRFAAYLQSPHAAFAGARPHYYSMRSLIVIPSTRFPTTPVATLALSTFSDLINTCLLQPIFMIQHFLPLFQSLPFANLNTNTNPTTSLNSKPNILILTPTIISSINPAFHLPEASVTSALSSFASVLEQELAPLSISVTHLQLGNFDLSGYLPHHRQLTLQSQRAETLRWDDSTRTNYGMNYAVSTSGKWGHQSNLRVLNKAILNAIYDRRGGVVHVGSGSIVYSFVGKWVPRSVVSWMMGLRKVKRQAERASSTDCTEADDVSSSQPSRLMENKYLYGQKDDEAFGDAGVWSLGFESKIGKDEFES